MLGAHVLFFTMDLQTSLVWPVFCWSQNWPGFAIFLAIFSLWLPQQINIVDDPYLAYKLEELWQLRIAFFYKTVTYIHCVHH